MQPTSVSMPKRRCLQVLVIDDDVRDIFSLASLVEGHTVRVVSKDNGKDGIGTAESQRD